MQGCFIIWCLEKSSFLAQLKIMLVDKRTIYQILAAHTEQVVTPDYLSRLSLSKPLCPQHTDWTPQWNILIMPYEFQKSNFAVLVWWPKHSHSVDLGVSFCLEQSLAHWHGKRQVTILKGKAEKAALVSSSCPHFCWMELPWDFPDNFSRE